MADPDIPPADGKRAAVTPSGEVEGSGMGAGGGQPGEDYDGDAASGDGYPLTGGEGEGQPDAPADGADPATGALRQGDAGR